MAPEAGCPFGISGNNLEKRGETNQEREEIIPAFSPIFIIPIHRHRAPVR